MYPLTRVTATRLFVWECNERIQQLEMRKKNYSNTVRYCKTKTKVITLANYKGRRQTIGFRTIELQANTRN